MKKIDQLLFKGIPIKGKSIHELYEVIEYAYNFIELMCESRTQDSEIKHQMHSPITVKKDETKTKRVWVEKLNSWILIPKDLDILHEEIYVQKILQRAKKFKQLAKKEKLDVMPIPEENGSDN